MANTTAEIENGEVRCPVCASTSVNEFLRREQVPIQQNFLMPDQESAVATTRGTLALTVCDSCGFVFNRAFDPALQIYGEGYENTQACSPSFTDHLDTLVDRLINQCNIRDCVVVEVGCGNGLFLRKLVSYPNSGIRGYGFDPSYTGPPLDIDGRLRFVQRYYDEDCAEIAADVVICRHVIEHLPRPVKLLERIKRALAQSTNPRLFFETPCVEWILKNRVIWDFFYEHCSYFNANSLTTAFAAAGFEVQQVSHVFGGQYLWLEAQSSTVKSHFLPGTTSTMTRQFATAERELTARWQRKVEDLAVEGKVAVWGAGAKGVTFANLVDPERKIIDCIVDLNPLKQGHFVPGTGHPIVSYQDLKTRGVKSAVLMNPNYYDENVELLKGVNLEVRLIGEL